MKMQTISKVLQFLLIGSFISFAFIGCVQEEEIDGPGTDTDSDLVEDVEANSTIAEVLEMYESTKESDDDFFQVTENLIFTGTVISSDQEGNVFKYITVQEESGKGIQVKLNQYDLYQSFPQGREVIINAEDMYIGNYGGLVQLGGLYNGNLGNVEEDSIANHITLLEGEVAMPEAMTIDLDALPENIEDYYNTWVKVTGVQFSREDDVFAAANESNSPSNLTLVNQNEETIILRTSTYASFSEEQVPTGSGDITAILTAYNGTLQLTLISTEDINFDQPRFEIEEEAAFEGQGEEILGANMSSTTIDFTTFAVASQTTWVAESGQAYINAWSHGKTESWMISKEALTLEGTAFDAPRLVVKENLDYFTQFEDVQILVSSDYAGEGDPNEATWTALVSEEERQSSGSNKMNFTFDGTQYVAFKYSAVDGTGEGSMSWSVSTVYVGEKYEETVIDPDPDSDNLALNGGFETWEDATAPAGWAKAENAEQESTVVYEGTYALKQTGGTKDIAQTIPVEAGKTYVISFAYQVDATLTDGTDARIWSHFRDADGSSLENGHIKGDGNQEMTDSNPSNSYLESKPGEWVVVTNEYVAPENSTELYLEFRTYKNAVVYWDAISVAEAE